MSERKIIAIFGQNPKLEYFHNNKPLIKLNYTNSLKEACIHLFSFTDNQLYGDEYDVVDQHWGVTPRQLIEYVSNDLLNRQLCLIIPTIKDNFWAKSLEKKITDHPYANFLITEIKTKEEVEMLNKHNAAIYKGIKDFDED